MASSRSSCAFRIARGLTGIGAFFFDVEFLTSSFGYFRIPPFEEFELATALGFDLGVFLCVVGAVLLALESFSRLGRRSGEQSREYAMDIAPSRIDTEQEG